jgi:hypothetical protein
MSNPIEFVKFITQILVEWNEFTGDYVDADESKQVRYQ